MALYTNTMFEYVFIFVMLWFWWLKGTLQSFGHFQLNMNVTIPKNDCTTNRMRESVEILKVGGSSSLHSS